MHPGEMLRNVVELCGYVARVHHVCSKNHSNYVVGFLMKQRGIRKADTSKIFILLISAFFCLYTFLPFSLCRNREDFMRKMKESGWDVNWSDKRKHIVFQNQDGKKVRDSNLSKRFHLDISKEVLESEFNRNEEKERTATGRNQREDAHLTDTTDSWKKLLQEQAEAIESLMKERDKLLEEHQSIFTEEQRRSAEQKWRDEQERAKAARRKNRRRYDPEL